MKLKTLAASALLVVATSTAALADPVTPPAPQPVLVQPVVVAPPIVVVQPYHPGLLARMTGAVTRAVVWTALEVTFHHGRR